MMKLNKTTKKAQGFIWSYNRSDCDDIEKAYKTCSQAKIDSFRKIWFRCKNTGGRGLRVISATCNFYTTAYQLGNDMIVDTYCNVYIIPDAFVE